MTKTPYGKREAPFSLRLSFEERAKLEHRAGSMPLSAYIKSLLFADDAPVYRQRRRVPDADEKLLAELLACLGASRLSNNLNQLAKAANSGSLYCDEGTKIALNRACDDVHAMRVLLMRGLGVQVDEPEAEKPKESTTQSFNRTAARRPSMFPKPGNKQ